MESAKEVMNKAGWIKDKFTPEDYLQIHIIDQNNCKKNEVIKWGEAA